MHRFGQHPVSKIYLISIDCMKKILLVYDGTMYVPELLDFALELHKLSPVSVTGLFLSPMDFSALWSFPVVPGTSASYVGGPEEVEAKEGLMEKAIKDFEVRCTMNGVLFSVRSNTDGLVFEAIQKESRFADLMIIGSEHFYKQFGEQPNEYLKEILRNSECGVLLLPDQCKFPQKIILAYDGGETSVFAIKQFAYLFPNFSKKRTLLMYAGDKVKDVPDQSLISELVLRHYPDMDVQLINMEDRDDLVHWLNNQQDALIVAGSFGRSAFSQLFKKSFLTQLISDQHLPMFISHK